MDSEAFVLRDEVGCIIGQRMLDDVLAEAFVEDTRLDTAINDTFVEGDPCHAPCRRDRRFTFFAIQRPNGNVAQASYVFARDFRNTMQGNVCGAEDAPVIYLNDAGALSAGRSATLATDPCRPCNNGINNRFVANNGFTSIGGDSSRNSLFIR